jgi:16S rRNA (cytosine967-C5)-methyltransferase
MRPPARVEAAIELLDAIIAAARDAGPAADTLVARYFAERRYAGSKDRRAVRELVYRAIRRAGERPASGRAAMLGLAAQDEELAALFDGSPHSPAPIADNEAAAPPAAAPAWLEDRFDPLLGSDEIAALLERAPLDLRVNRLKGSVEDALTLFPHATRTPLSPIGLRLPPDARVEDRGGLVEIQDEGSQLIALACDARSGETVVDLCAGAGGKTLALAAEMENRGRIIACDSDRGRLSRLPERAHLAGVTIAETLLLDPGKELEALAELRGQADLVLVDAPCSGTGTWRRNPETRWRLTPQRLDTLVELQGRLLDIARELVRPGGRLVYAVCSLLASEGRGQAESFSGRSALVPEALPIKGGRDAGTGRLLSPADDGTDGFFVARWRAPC